MTGSAEPSRSVEIERKYDADADTPVPDLSRLPGVASVDAPQVRALDARYVDTAELTLACAGFAVRRRTGGPDEGWHLKGPAVEGARVEMHWPLGESDAIPPAMLAAVVGALGTPVAAEDLTPLARIRNTRTAYALRDRTGAVVAEFVDDLVSTRDERTGADRSWREWELELGPAAPVDAEAFFTAAGQAVVSAGGRDAASASKLARALGR